MVVELTKPIERRVGDIVIRIDVDGAITLRGYRKKRAAAAVPLETIATYALGLESLSLTELEWAKPLRVIQRLAYHVREHRVEPTRDLRPVATHGCQTAGDWNAAYPVGATVRCWIGNDGSDGSSKISKTSAEAFNFGSIAGVEVEGVKGAIPLSRVQPIERAT